MYLYQATGDRKLQRMGATVLESLDSIARTECGYAVIHDVITHQLANRMESFFLAETTKYLYLLFDEENFIHNSGAVGTLIRTPHGQCVIDSGGYVFNTEAHPIDAAALDCCHNPARQQFRDAVSRINVLNAFDIKGTKRERLKPSTPRDTDPDREADPDPDRDADPAREADSDPDREVEEEEPMDWQRKEFAENYMTCKVESFFTKFTINGQVIPAS